METPVAPAMPWKTSKNNQNWANRGKSNEIKSKLACILEASESTRLRMGESLPNHHENHSAGKGGQFTAAWQFGSQIYSYASSHENSRSKTAVDKEWENWRNFRRGTWRKSGTNQRWSMKQERRAQKFISPHWWTSVIWKMLNWRQSTKNKKVQLYSDVIL